MDNSLEYQKIVNSFLSKWVKIMSGCNYVVELGVKSLSHGDEKLGKEDIVARIFQLSDSESKDIQFVKTSKAELQKEINKLVVLGEFDSSPNHFTKESIKDINNKFLPQYYEHMKHYINLSAANIYKLNNVPDAPALDIFWSFCYLISDHSRRASIVIFGGAGD